MTNEFSDRMNAQRAILKQINGIPWPNEELFALSEDAIQRWTSVNYLKQDQEIVQLARAAGDALLFLANASQDQVSSEYSSRKSNITSIFERLRSLPEFQGI